MLKTIRARITAAGIAIVVSVLMLNTFLNYSVAHRNNDQLINASLSSISSSHATALADWIMIKKRNIESLTDEALMENPRPYFRSIIDASGFTNIYVSFTNKTTQFEGITDVPLDYDATSRPWFTQAVNAGHTIVTEPYMDDASGILVVTVATPITKEGVLLGVVAGDMAMDTVINNVLSIHPAEKSFGMLINRSGTIIANADPSLTLKPITELSPNFDMTKLLMTTTRKEVEIDNEMTLVRAKEVAGTDWLVMVVLNKAVMNEGSAWMLTLSLISLVVLAAGAALIISLIMAKVLKRLALVRDSMLAISSGDADLTQRLPDQGGDEVSQIASAFNQFVGNLGGIMSQIRDTSHSVHTASDEIAAGNRELSGRTESAAASLQQTASSLEQITATVAQSADSARQAGSITESATSAAQHGGEVVNTVLSTMGDIENASDKIRDIISVIDGIAFQTNILALNAAVEAARAGEQGRGFSVVASEVRSLAQRCSHAAREIKDLIEATVESVMSGACQVREANDAMDNIIINVENVTQIMKEIQDATAVQMVGINEINQAVHQLDGIVQQNAAMVEESTTAAAALQDQAASMTRVIGRFRIE
ncbi:HAMP domain-containing protein [Jejubacter calystegiae]|uniref:HAMP domain-containing protein n=1 Tax=Jejubacter calystegiae TaxID=2579935 RepID=A0A4P8YHH7_9ENTR|nr:methyl-accepting chemotaxis protein [Jejubacter calystegiae]QCT19014.1 HAMP domain-containing protein [Jejubacter calystegiae]